jgi:phosphoadenosine phosphosulfate reductase
VTDSIPLPEPGAGGAAALAAPPDDAEPAEILAWALARFARHRVVITTAFGMEGCVLIDLLARRAEPATVTWLDTGFFFAETHELRARLERRYPAITFENRGTALSPEAQAAAYGPELWRRDPDRCCALRKVAPMDAVLAGADVWITAITRSQSAARAQVRAVAWDARRGVLKVSPLAGWDRARVWEYVRAHDVPYNALHERGYPTIGCTHCTAPVHGAGPGDYSRAGRWAGTGKTECGLHLPAAGAGDG